MEASIDDSSSKDDVDCFLAILVAGIKNEELNRRFSPETPGSDSYAFSVKIPVFLSRCGSTSVFQTDRNASGPSQPTNLLLNTLVSGEKYLSGTSLGFSLTRNFTCQIKQFLVS